MKIILRTLFVCVFAAWAIPALSQSPNAFGIPTAEWPNPAAGIVAVPGSRAQGFAGQGRSEVIARHGIVATSDPLAAQAGLEILQQGGNAIDAAVAAAAVLDVTSQNDTGLAGDLFALVWSAADRRLYALNSAGWAPAGWTPGFFKEQLGVERIPGRGVNSATVPGAVAGYDALLERFGTMDFRQTLERAARIAEEGWGQSERRHVDLTRQVGKLLEDPDSARVFLDGREAPALYSIIRNPGLADALRILQEEGKDAFYRGAIADALVAKVQSLGGVMTHEDLAEFEPEWVEPISTSYHGHDVHQLPPPGQGWAALEMLNILEMCAPVHGLNLSALGPSSPDYWHFMVEAKKLAYSDLQAYNADPLFNPPPLNQLLSKTYALSLCDRIDMNKAAEPSVTGGLDGGTIYLTTADRWGNMVSLIHSIFSVYGSGITIPPYGMILHNRGVGFTLDEDHPNVVAPRKRPFHSIIAGFVSRNGEPLMTFGNMGGAVQPETHAQHMVNVIDHGMNVQMTTDAARFTHNQNSNVLSLEHNLFDLVGPALRARGHNVRGVDGGAVGGYQGILFTRDPEMTPPLFNQQSIDEDLPVNGVYRAGSDHRKDGQAVGW
ncbi:MAG: gamma-glutamyltransferase family protein [Gammaproteobacteria bacterium]|nr:gamma-glutamyltransferase family protein [Gammaproteobacteria bacterium]MYA37265.1 gamma-glutamyltransferase family protein [Gammaproteobacteria bacterium]MYA67003.1 gamma-glutamyltransferase family protein [Gammaproteobacteria bacterium]MYE30020.1 gamma-glutamyltransferase family protein [Gammaproteobacteria bacterium]MYH47100.1 gamma-glutamyltransferase family protein [Gammaproteobacteria bacterium]